MGSGGSSAEAEREPLLVPSHAEPDSPVHSRVYGRRWLVLALFSLLGFMQGMVWNFWGPIQNSAVQAFGFSSSDIAVLVLWGPVGFVPWLLFMWLMDKKGLRASLLLAAFFMLLGSALRSIPLTEQPLRRWLIHGGHFLNGLAGPTIMSSGPFLSTTWFAPDQRATATAVASLFCYLGSAASFLVGPLAVPAPNRTGAASATIVAAVSVSSIRDRIQLVMYAELTVIAVLFATVLLYFPSRPPMPPSVAAASQRLSYRSSICRLLSRSAKDKKHLADDAAASFETSSEARRPGRPEAETAGFRRPAETGPRDPELFTSISQSSAPQRLTLELTGGLERERCRTASLAALNPVLKTHRGDERDLKSSSMLFCILTFCSFF
ncbi:solute carrier family 49 member 4 [Cebidichthys violaceus]|uniref:solute carrier family 49 member 4 n=1 Tax=Cebidichthys violaceus TaxID=271503 RepID=UPI0035CAE432